VKRLRSDVKLMVGNMDWLGMGGRFGPGQLDNLSKTRHLCPKFLKFERRMLVWATLVGQ
jgi:hypothetical protein